ncbi:MAG: hypothetical protein HY315_08220 [Acidobacteria bacterium]|nr:hypothetical protein [Acidobacteriota bacterium]
MVKNLAVIGASIVAISALFYYLSVSPVRHECEIVFEYKGHSVTTRGAGATREEAIRAAVTVACGQVSNGMAELIQCENTPPKSETCK